MRAIVVDEDGFTPRTDLPVPVPEDGEALVKVLACGTCGSDLHVYEGDPNYAWMESRFPVIMGHEIVGRRVGPDGSTGDGLVVVRPGTGRAADGSPVRIGLDRNGGFAEYVRAPEACLYDLPEEVGVRTAVLCEPLTVAVSALRRSGAQESLGPDLRVQVVGMGAVGLLAALVMLANGCARVEIVGTERDRELGSFETADALGLSPVLPEDATAERDLIFNAAGSPIAITQAISRLAAHGTLLNIALGVGEVGVNIDLLTRGSNSLINVYGSQPADWPTATGYLARGEIQPAGIISHLVPLEEVVSGFELLKQGGARKVIIDVDIEG
jgi:threonine dehydrogenase-like Zn-dependent dehydrogenase